jgi:hypothetical protein
LVGLVGKLVSAPLAADAFTTTIEASSESSNNNVRAILLPGDKLIWDHDRVFLGQFSKESSFVSINPYRASSSFACNAVNFCWTTLIFCTSGRGRPGAF